MESEQSKPGYDEKEPSGLHEFSPLAKELVQDVARRYQKLVVEPVWGADMCLEIGGEIRGSLVFD